MRRLLLCLVAVLGAVVVSPAALADGGPFFVTQGGAGVATHDGRFHYVAVSNGSRSTILEKVQVAGGQVNSWFRSRARGGRRSSEPPFSPGRVCLGTGARSCSPRRRGPGSPSRFVVIDTRRMHLLRKIVLPGFYLLRCPVARRVEDVPDPVRVRAPGDLTDYVVRGSTCARTGCCPGRSSRGRTTRRQWSARR